MSSGAASSRCAASFVAFSRTLRAASSTAVPPTAVVRLPYVPQPIEICAGVAVDHLDILDGDAQLLADELREGRLLALAVRVGAG